MSVRETLVNEPVAVANSIAAVIESAIVLGIAFGVDVTPEQIASITAFVIVLGQSVATIVGRSKVSPI